MDTGLTICRYVLHGSGLGMQIGAAFEYLEEEDHRMAHENDAEHNWGITTVGFQYVYLVILLTYVFMDRYFSYDYMYYTVSGITMGMALFSILCNVQVRRKYLPQLEKLSLVVACFYIAGAILACIQASAYT